MNREEAKELVAKCSNYINERVEIKKVEHILISIGPISCTQEGEGKEVCKVNASLEVVSSRKKITMPLSVLVKYLD